LERDSFLGFPVWLSKGNANKGLATFKSLGRRGAKSFSASASTSNSGVAWAEALLAMKGKEVAKPEPSICST
jgi:hypothetical protein